MDYKEAMFGVNAFNKENVSKGNDVLITTILMILFGKPGFYPSYPNLGMYIQQYFYNQMENIDTAALTKQLAVQCSILKDDVLSGDIQIKLVYNSDKKTVLLVSTPTMEIIPNNILVIGISTDNTGNMIYNYEIMKMAEYA